MASNTNGTVARDAEKGTPSYHSQDQGQGASIRHAVTPGGHAVDTTQPAFPIYHRRFANPAPLGLMGFATTTLVLSLINVGTRGITIPDIIIGLAFAYGGLAQLLAGMWEFACGNTFGATAFSTYGAFWIAFAWTLSPWAGVTDSYADAETQLNDGLALFLFGFFICTFIFFLASLRSSIALASVFFFLFITFILLGAGKLYTDMTAITTAGGAFGIITAFLAYYVAMSGLLTPDTSYIVVPVGNLSKRD